MTDKTLDADLEKRFIEQLASLEHDQWITWSKEILKRMVTFAQTNNGLIAFSMEQEQRWTPNWIPYTELSDNVQEHDRKWARKVLAIVNQGYSFCYQKGFEKGKTAGRDEGKKVQFCVVHHRPMTHCHSCRMEMEERLVALEAELKYQKDLPKRTSADQEIYQSMKNNITALEERLKTERQAGRDEHIAPNTGCGKCQRIYKHMRLATIQKNNEDLIQKLAALSKEKEALEAQLLMKTNECKISSSENARLQDALDEIEAITYEGNIDSGDRQFKRIREVKKKALEENKKPPRHSGRIGGI